MSRKERYALSILFATLFIFGCASIQTPQRLSMPPLSSTQYSKKMDNFLIVFDSSSSMEMPYKGFRRFDLAKNVIHHITDVLPDAPINGGLCSFGHSVDVSREKTVLFYEVKKFQRSEFKTQVDRISKPGGTSPLGIAIEASVKDLEKVEGRSALIIISDGAHMGNTAVEIAARMAGLMGDRLCIHTIQVGDDPQGGALLQKISEQTPCGSFVGADSLSSGEGIMGYVERVLFSKQMDADGDGIPDDADQCPKTPKSTTVDEKGCPLDSDFDGVTDSSDQCPNTPRGAAVDSKGCPVDSDGDGVSDGEDRCPGTAKGIAVDPKGCPLAATQGATVTAAGTWLYKDIQFESGKWDIRTQSTPTLDEIAQFLSANPKIRVEIQGHTDGRGKRAYNLQLSEKRAQSVRTYLIGKGIPADRIQAKGYGPDRPIATNDTADGRERNRRVELKPIE